MIKRLRANRSALCLLRFAPALMTVVLLTLTAIPVSTWTTRSTLSLTALHWWFYPNANHFYTTDPNSPGPGWQYNGICCYVEDSQVEGTVPFHRWYNTRWGNHFYSIDPSNPGPDFVYEGHCCYIYPNQVLGTVPLHRFTAWIDNGSRWIWSTNMNCCAGWNYEGIAGYVAPN